MNNITGKELIDSRKDLPVYGDRIANMVAVAHIWTGILGHEVQPYQVPLMLAAMKIQRAAKTPEYKDSSDDVDGYMEIFREVMGDDLIEARTVEEFRAKTELKAEKVQQPEGHGNPYRFVPDDDILAG